MTNIILVKNFKVEKQNKKYLYSLQILGGGTYSLLSDEKIISELEVAKLNNNEDLYFNTIENACEKILIHNDFFFDGIEII